MASPATDNVSGKPKRKRRWLQFGLPTLVTLSAVVLALIVYPAERQKRAVEAIERLGGGVGYAERRTNTPEWLRSWVSQDHFRTVSSVSFYKTQVSDADLQHLKGLTGVESLHLGGTQIGDAGLQHLTGLTRLQDLLLWETQVGDKGLEQLQGLTGLQSLNLADTQLTNTGLKHLKSLTRLKGLGLSDTRVSDAGVAHLTALTGLQYLELHDTQVSDAGIAKLHASLPGCEIGMPQDGWLYGTVQ